MDTGGLDYMLHSENYKGETYVAREDSFFAEWVKGNKHAGKIDDRFTVGEAIKWIDQGKSPFFLMLNLQNSHIPYEVPADFPRHYSKREEDFEFTFAYLKPEQVQNARDRYSDSLRYVDHQLGRLIDHLKETGQWDNTVFVLTGDHGQGFMEHGFFTHGRELYNEVMRVPLVVHAPGLDPRSDGRLAQHVDVPPTICQILGIPPHPAWQGEGLLSAEPTAGKEVFMIVQTPFSHQYAMVHGTHKLIYDRRQDRTFLYDLQGDPGEMHDIAAASPTLLKKLSERLGSWRALQNGYYRNKELMQKTYPPVLLPDATLTAGY